MNYDEFKEYVLLQMEKKYPEEEYDLMLRKMIKNNGMYMEGLCIFKKGGYTSPTIYLESYYERYRRGSIMAEILSSIENEYEEGMKKAPDFKHVTASYEMIKDQIVMRLVNYEKNREILDDCPHIRFHDLAITFRWLAYQDEIGISSALITKKELKLWGISLNQLYEDASYNTPRIFPSKIVPLADIIPLHALPLKKGDFELYVLTNEPGINGATAVLYDYLLDEFGEQIGSSFYILPSSIHEMMLCPERDDIRSPMLLSLVSEANRMVVSLGEVLSDNIYFYDIHEKRLHMIEA